MTPPIGTIFPIIIACWATSTVFFELGFIVHIPIDYRIIPYSYDDLFSSTAVWAFYFIKMLIPNIILVLILLRIKNGKTEQEARLSSKPKNIFFILLNSVYYILCAITITSSILYITHGLYIKHTTAYGFCMLWLFFFTKCTLTPEIAPKIPMPWFISAIAFPYIAVIMFFHGKDYINDSALSLSSKIETIDHATIDASVVRTLSNALIIYKDKKYEIIQKHSVLKITTQ